jgi:hypothetical protein
VDIRNSLKLAAKVGVGALVVVYAASEWGVSSECGITVITGVAAAGTLVGVRAIEADRASITGILCALVNVVASREWSASKQSSTSKETRVTGALALVDGRLGANGVGVAGIG